jgi:RNA polymerase sigma-70 factor (ECF subfamily)
MVERRPEEPPLSTAAASAPSAATGGRFAGPSPKGGIELEQLFREHGRSVLRAAMRVTGSAQDAEDVVQTVFMRLVRSGGASALSENPANYLHRAAINASLDVVRSRRTRAATPLTPLEGTLVDAGEVGPEASSISREIRQEVRRALADVSPRAAEIFALRYFEGYDNHEIARMVGTSRSTVAVILHRTRHRLRDAIRPLTGGRS